jgi:hypothetical protein
MTDRRTDASQQVLNPRALATAAALLVAGCVLGVIAFALWPLVGLRPLWCTAPLLRSGWVAGRERGSRSFGHAAVKAGLGSSS